LNKRRGAAKRSHKRSGRASPPYAAKLFSIGFTKKGNDGNLWRIATDVNGVKKWKRV